MGIICSCLPLMTPIFLKHHRPFAKLKSTLLLQNTFHRLKNRPTRDVHLETGILGSAFGDGKFLRTEDLASHPTSSDVEEDAEPKIGSRHWAAIPEPAPPSPVQARIR